MRVLFWGTPEFALPSLKSLEGEGHYIAGVVTQPDRPAGRGRVRRPSPVREWSDREGYRVLTPDSPKGPDFIQDIEALEPEVSVVVAYGHILTEEVLALPPHGSINLHASLLPELRGAAPINWAIARGHQMTGVTIMRMVREMDAGAILGQYAEPILENDTVSSLAPRLSEDGAALLVETLAMMEAGVLEEREQNHAEATFAPKVDRMTARVNWSRSAQEVAWHVRGMDAVPGAWSTLAEQPVKLFTPTPRDHSKTAPGTLIEADPKGELLVACGKGAVAFAEVQPAGKPRMPASAWLRGRGAEAGQRFQ